MGEVCNLINAARVDFGSDSTRRNLAFILASMA